MFFSGNVKKVDHFFEIDAKQLISLRNFSDMKSIKKNIAWSQCPFYGDYVLKSLDQKNMRFDFHDFMIYLHG